MDLIIPRRSSYCPNFATAPQQQLHMDAFEWWSNKNHGFVVDYAYIDTTAPTKHIRHEARAYLGEITINDHQAAEIWNELQNCRATHLDVMSRDVVLAPARNDTVPIQEVSVQTACH